MLRHLTRALSLLFPREVKRQAADAYTSAKVKASDAYIAARAARADAELRGDTRDIYRAECAMRAAMNELLAGRGR